MRTLAAAVLFLTATLSFASTPDADNGGGVMKQLDLKGGGVMYQPNGDVA